MTRRISRTASYELTLQIKRDEFIQPPRESQRNWLLSKAIQEFASDLDALSDSASRFVAGSAAAHADIDRLNDDLGDQQIMEDWQIPLMSAMAKNVTETHGDVLEIGFGRGISAELIQQQGVRSHTIVECNPSIIHRFERWRARHAEQDIQILAGQWQDCIDQFGSYDGIFFHAYPLTDEEFVNDVLRSVTYGAHFFATASAHLRKRGVFTYLTHEIDSLSRAQQRLLLKHFSELSLRNVPLSVPETTADAWWADSMVVIKAIK